MMYKLFKLQLLFVLVAVLQAQRRTPQKCRMTNIACDYDKTLLVDVVCQYKLARSVFGIFTLKGTMLEPLDKIAVSWLEVLNKAELTQKIQTCCGINHFQMSVKSYKKNSGNHWQPGYVNFMKTDVCSILNSSGNILFKSLIELLGGYPDIIQTCPYKVNFFFHITP
jgi:hypothetical protein